MHMDHVDRLVPHQLRDMVTRAGVDRQFERHPCGHPINPQPIHFISA